MIEDIEEQIKSVCMILMISRSNGEIIKLSKIVDEDEVISTLYIPKIDVSLHGRFLGESPDGLLYKKFTFNLRADEEELYSSIINDFLSGGWVFSFDSEFESY
jgi:hypothetical protein